MMLLLIGSMHSGVLNVVLSIFLLLSIKELIYNDITCFIK